jgi:hypothetical protein
VAGKSGKSRSPSDRAETPRVPITVLYPPDGNLDEHGRLALEVQASIAGYDGWLVRAEVLTDLNGGTARVVALHLRLLPDVEHPSPGGGPVSEVTAGMLRAIRPSSLLRAVEELMLVNRELDMPTGHNGRPLFDRRFLDEVVSAFQKGRKRGRPREISDAQLAEVAKRYVDLRDNPSPLRTLADELSYSYSRTRSMIEMARARGLLGKTIRGRKGGYLTPSGKAALKEANDHGTR